MKRYIILIVNERSTLIKLFKALNEINNEWCTIILQFDKEEMSLSYHSK